MNNIQRVKVPLPFPLRWVNSYLMKGDSGFTVIDPGLHTDDAKEAWGSTLRDAGIDWPDINQIVLTHHHPDHFGLSGWMQEKTGAPVFITESAWRQAYDLWFGDQKLSNLILGMFRRHGLRQTMMSPMEEHMNRFIEYVSPAPEVHLMDMNDSITLGDVKYELIHTPGHALGHASFYQAETGILFCGDHVMPRITPNVSYIPTVDENPLQRHLSSLEDMTRREVRMAYPGHWHPFTDYHKRIREIIAHHEQRLDQIRAYCRDEWIHDMRLCELQFGNKLSIHQLRFALSETIAHTLYLEQKGILQRRQTNDDFVSWKS